MITEKADRTIVANNLGTNLTRTQFEHLIPHAGGMCLIDLVEFWTNGSIYCLSRSHLNKSNPLRTNGELSSIHLLEYGAQAMAIHGGLLNRTASKGMLASFRNVQFNIDTVDTLTDPIRITAIAEANTGYAAAYRFEISELDSRILVEARATVVSQ